MLKRLLLLLGFLTSLTTQAQVATFDMMGALGDQISQPVTTQAANVTATALTRSSSLTPLAAPNTMSSLGVPVISDDNKYYRFDIIYDPIHYNVFIPSFTLSWQRSIDGPTQVKIEVYFIDENGNRVGELYFNDLPLLDGSQYYRTSGTTTIYSNRNGLTLYNINRCAVMMYFYGAQVQTGSTFGLTKVVVNGNVPLPVNLISFMGKSTPHGIDLSWVTSWERSNEGFDILKSKTTSGFEKVGFLKGTGDAQALTNYTFTDTDLEKGQLYYYQLKQKDTDGQYALSQIIAVRAQSDLADTEPILYPNPSQGSFTVAASQISADQLSLFDALGQQVPINISQGQQASTLVVKTPISTADGVYILSIKDATGRPAKQLKVNIHR